MVNRLNKSFLHFKATSDKKSSSLRLISFMWWDWFFTGPSDPYRAFFKLIFLIWVYLWWYSTQVSDQYSACFRLIIWFSTAFLEGWLKDLSLSPLSSSIFSPQLCLFGYAVYSCRWFKAHISKYALWCVAAGTCGYVCVTVVLLPRASARSLSLDFLMRVGLSFCAWTDRCARTHTLNDLPVPCREG